MQNYCMNCLFMIVYEISKAFRRYAKSFSIEIIDSKDYLIQLIASKSSIKIYSKTYCMK